MNLLKLIKDIALIPIDIVLDCAMITPVIKIINDEDTDTPFGTIDRIESIMENINESSYWKNISKN